MQNSEFLLGTAGGRMISAFPRVQMGETIEDIEELIVKGARAFDSIYYVYVVDEENVLQGTITLKEVHANLDKSVRAEEIMNRKLVVAHPLTDQERVVYLTLSSNMKELPVVDEGGHLLGVVPYNTVLKIFNEEVREDTLIFRDIFHKVGDEYTTIDSSTLVMIKRRLLHVYQYTS